MVLGLIGGIISHEIQLVQKSLGGGGRNGNNGVSIGYVLWILCTDLEDRIKKRKYFHKSAKLIKDGIISIIDPQIKNDDLFNLNIEIDRRMLDYVCGLDTQFSEFVNGSNLYFPQVTLNQVILAPEKKQKIIDIVSNFATYKSVKKKLGFNEILTYGSSLVLLFYGISGSGKTLFANALANHLKKKILLVNFSMIDENALKWVFREAKINDAILFFDECENYFESRHSRGSVGGGSNVLPLLSFLEKENDVLVIMATNCPQSLDEAMNRRITYSCEFVAPDPIMREEIWKNHIPSQMLAKTSKINWKKLAIDYELTGGLIKNAVLSALNFAISRTTKERKEKEKESEEEEDDDIILIEEDLINGAKTQLRTMLGSLGEERSGNIRGRRGIVNGMNIFNIGKKIVPKFGMSRLIVSKNLENQIETIIRFEKSRKILFGKWGFSKTYGNDDGGNEMGMGTSVLCFGESGTGKSIASKVIGFELGKKLKVFNFNQLITSRDMFRTLKNIELILQECKKSGSILVIEFNHGRKTGKGKGIGIGMMGNNHMGREEWLNMFWRVIETITSFDGIVIFETNLINYGQFPLLNNESFQNMFQFVLKFEKPDLQLRYKLWNLLCPKELPVSFESNKEIVFKKLAKYELSGGQIWNCLITAASQCALSKDQIVTINLLTKICKQQCKQFQESFSMYQ